MTTLKTDHMREILAKTVDRLLDDEKPLDVSRAKCIAELIQTEINTYKLDIEMAKTTNKGRVINAERDAAVKIENGTKVSYLSHSGLGG